MTTLSLLVALAAFYGVVGSRGYVRALALGGATPAGAAAVLAGEALPTFYALAVGALVGLALRIVVRGTRRPLLADEAIPGMMPLMVLAVWSVSITMISPFLFDGLLLPSGARLQAGVLTASNAAQIIYIVLSLAVVIFVARSRAVGPDVVGLMVGLVTILSFWSYLGSSAGLPFPVGLFDNSPSFIFIETSAGGAERVRGILSEPASLATSSLASLAYMVARSRQVKGRRLIGTLLVAGMALTLGLVSTSATFFVAGGVLVCFAALATAGSVVVRNGLLSPLGITLTAMLGCVLVWALPLLSELLDGIITQKVSSSSFDDRSTADADAFRLSLDTFGIGVGMGADRPSSFVAALFSTVGLVGAVSFFLFVWATVKASIGVKPYRPVLWALTAVLVSKVISGPDLNDAGGVMWFCLAVLAHAGVRRERERRPDARILGNVVGPRPEPPIFFFAPLSSRRKSGQAMHRAPGPLEEER